MIFRKNKPDSAPAAEPAAPRGREHPAGGGDRGVNALARRFMTGEEPDTKDLSGAPGFPDHAPEPETRPAAGLAPEAASPPGTRLISHDSESGKFYVHPGTPELPVLLEGEPVTQRSELRKGDRIRIGGAEFAFLGPA